MADRCEMTLVTDPSEWDALFSRAHHPHLVQSWPYGEAKERAADHRTHRVVDAGGWRARRAVFTRGDEPVAICQFLDKTVAGIPCAARLNRGPLFIDATPDEDLVKSVYGAIKGRRQRRCVCLVLAPALPANDANAHLLRELGFRPQKKGGWLSTRVDIAMTQDELRANLTSKWRNRLKAAEKSELTFREYQAPEGIEWIVDRHVANMHDKGFEGPAPALLTALYEAAPDSLLVFQAQLHDEPVGGMLVYRFARGAEYYVGWMSTEGKRFNVGNYLYWNIALELQRRGCEWIDLGGQRPGATEQFKRGLRGTEYQLLNEWLVY